MSSTDTTKNARVEATADTLKVPFLNLRPIALICARLLEFAPGVASFWPSILHIPTAGFPK